MDISKKRKEIRKEEEKNFSLRVKQNVFDVTKMSQLAQRYHSKSNERPVYVNTKPPIIQVTIQSIIPPSADKTNGKFFVLINKILPFEKVDYSKMKNPYLKNKPPYIKNGVLFSTVKKPDPAKASKEKDVDFEFPDYDEIKVGEFFYFSIYEGKTICENFKPGDQALLYFITTSGVFPDKEDPKVNSTNDEQEFFVPNQDKILDEHENQGKKTEKPFLFRNFSFARKLPFSESECANEILRSKDFTNSFICNSINIDQSYKFFTKTLFFRVFKENNLQELEQRREFLDFNESKFQLPWVSSISFIPPEEKKNYVLEPNNNNVNNQETKVYTILNFKVLQAENLIENEEGKKSPSSVSFFKLFVVLYESTINQFMIEDPKKWASLGPIIFSSLDFFISVSINEKKTNELVETDDSEGIGISCTGRYIYADLEKFYMSVGIKVSKEIVKGESNGTKKIPGNSRMIPVGNGSSFDWNSLLKRSDVEFIAITNIHKDIVEEYKLCELDETSGTEFIDIMINGLKGKKIESEKLSEKAIKMIKTTTRDFTYQFFAIIPKKSDQASSQNVSEFIKGLQAFIMNDYRKQIFDLQNHKKHLSSFLLEDDQQKYIEYGGLNDDNKNNEGQYENDNNDDDNNDDDENFNQEEEEDEFNQEDEFTMNQAQKPLSENEDLDFEVEEEFFEQSQTVPTKTTKHGGRKHRKKSKKSVE